MTRKATDRVVDLVFRRMASLYGNAFAEKWRGVDADDVRDTWATGLGGFTDQQIVVGLERLFHHPGPPDLPAFMALCRPQIATNECLTDERQRLTSEGEAQLERIKAMTKKAAFLPDSPRGDSIEWAYRMLAKAEQGHAYNAMQIAFARDAIRNYEATHHVERDHEDETDFDLPAPIPSPHIYSNEPVRQREPGDDDEEIAA